MNIMIITTWYPPDTAIAAVRPYMFAKYLTKYGHKVTVIRSGLINKMKDDFFPELDDVEVLSYLGNDVSSGNYVKSTKQSFSAEKSRRLELLPSSLRGTASHVYSRLKRPAMYIKQKRTVTERLEKLKATIDTLRERDYDIVFSTYSDLENAYGGQYASEVFHCKWVMDFRDPIAQRGAQPIWEYYLRKREQDRIIEAADLCTVVSDGAMLDRGKRSSKIVTINNGYEQLPEDKKSSIHSDTIEVPEDVLSFCYTGLIYRERKDAAEEFIKAAASLIAEGSIDPNNLKLYYAGNGSDIIMDLVKKYSAENILVDLGYLPKSEIEYLQDRTDVFVVLSWNTRFEKGVLTGKFYEGLRADKPIISIVAGDETGSELYSLNEKYNYGYCCELADKSGYEGLKTFIIDLYSQKKATGKVTSMSLQEIKDRFRYDNISRKLEEQFENLLKGSTL